MVLFQTSNAKGHANIIIRSFATTNLKTGLAHTHTIYWVTHAFLYTHEWAEKLSCRSLWAHSPQSAKRQLVQKGVLTILTELEIVCALP
ncbi:hypothetical protein Zmor_009171 [Zophobas morio]|uniref:Uncharacterized protein n=1 Tax=Zophobas morio TaxID=2755281 RepID=A0AA38IL37_9CUCU|nr:hypothetical protein Zmor_009171 [Zophobas morio]